MQNECLLGKDQQQAQLEVPLAEPLHGSAD